MTNEYPCDTCGKTGAWDDYFSMGVHVGRYCCEECWLESEYHDAQVFAYHALAAGESWGEVHA